MSEYSNEYPLNLHRNMTTLVDDDNDMSGVLDALIELHQLDLAANNDFTQDHNSIVKAIQLNEQMQQQVALQLEFIDKQLQYNQNTMTETKYLANAENRFGQRIFVHKRYDEPVNYFDSSELLEPIPSIEEESQEEEDQEYIDQDEEDEETLPNKAWSRYERNRLIAGIQSEAKRSIAYDYMKVNEAWRVWDVDKMDPEFLERFDVSRLNWDRISSIHVLSRTANECLMQWTTQEHPLINKKPWSKQESERLAQLVQQFGIPGHWLEIANKLNTNRTISQCFSHYMAEQNNALARSLKWTPEEDKRLSDAVKIFGSCNWQQIAAMLTGRTGQQCLHRWTKSINPAIKRSKWTEAECVILRRAVKLYGVGTWKKVQRLLPGRTDMQCRERWVNIEQQVKRTKMTAEEVEKMVQLVEEHGTKWSLIATYFPGRTDNNILREYTQFKNKASAQEKKQLTAARKQQKEQEKQAQKGAKRKGRTTKASTPRKKTKLRHVSDEEKEVEGKMDNLSEEEVNPQCEVVRQTRYATRLAQKRPQN